MIIKNLKAEEIFNAQGMPTLQCSITLENNQFIQSSIPSNFVSPQKATLYRYDKDERLFQKGMKESVDIINSTIAPILINETINALAMDSKLMDLNINKSKETIGSNTTLVVSMALFKAQAIAENSNLYEFLQSLSGSKRIHIPTPVFSILQGRQLLCQNNIKEFLLIPQQESFQKNIESAATFYHHMQKILMLKKQSITLGSYGSFVPAFYSFEEYFNLIEEVFKTLPQYTYQIGLNIAASDIYDIATKTYQWNNKAILAQELISEYEHIIKKYSYITYIQDGMSEHDDNGWKQMTSYLDDSMIIAGDTIFASNPMSIRKGILKKIANTTIIKPEYLGTVSQVLAAIDACKNNNRPFIIASDIGQTAETFYSDLAMGTEADFIKFGGLSQYEHTAKYNRLLSISQEIK